MSIRKIFLLLAIAFILLALLTAGSLSHLTEKMYDLAEESNRKMESVKASEELQVSLLQFSRDRLRTSIFRDARRPNQNDELELAVRENLKRVEQYADSTTELEILKAINLKIESYLSASDRLIERPLTEKEYNKSVAPLLDRAVELSEKFTDLNERQAELLTLQISAENDKANSLAISLAVFCIVTFLASLLALRHLIVRPLSRLSEQLSALSDENKIQTLNENGPVEIKSISSAFNKLASQVLNRRKTVLQFLAGVAHDLRNPLNAIRMSSELLSDQSISQEERESIVQIISRQAQQLDRMVGDLLDTTRIEAGQLEMKPTKSGLTGLLQDAVNLHKSVSQLHQFHLHLPSVDPSVFIDKARISQVLNNLLSNAIKYSPNGGPISVSLTVNKQQAVIEVTDPGIGISEVDQKSIFEPFKRTNATKLSIPGVGLGLSVSKKIIEAHNGRIEVQSEPDHGSTFRIVLPRLASHRSTNVIESSLH